MNNVNKAIEELITVGDNSMSKIKNPITSQEKVRGLLSQTNNDRIRAIFMTFKKASSIHLPYIPNTAISKKQSIIADNIAL